MISQTSGSNMDHILYVAYILGKYIDMGKENPWERLQILKLGAFECNNMFAFKIENPWAQRNDLR